MDNQYPKSIAGALVVVALVPWAYDIVRILLTSFGVIEYSVPYTSIEQAKSEVISWKPLWHIVVLIGFLILLFKSRAIDRRRKPRWLLGLLFLWPVVSVLFIYEALWKPASNHSI